MTVCDIEFDECAGIPEEIEHKKYATERDLLIDLKKFGLSDLHILLNQDGIGGRRGGAIHYRYEGHL